MRERIAAKAKNTRARGEAIAAPLLVLLGVAVALVVEDVLEPVEPCDC